jgi:hypothetical protein
MNKLLLEVSQSFFYLAEAFMTLGRLTALQALNSGQLRDKNLLIEKSAEFIETANQISIFLNRSYAFKSPLVTWHENSHPIKNRFLISEGIDNRRIEEFQNHLLAAILYEINKTIKNIESCLNLQPALRFLKKITLVNNFANTNAKISMLLGSSVIHTNASYKSLNGPPHVTLDKAFFPTDSLLETDVAEYGDTVLEAAPYYWGLSARESVAADMCCLSLIEYDGLPIDFYRDMAKQAWDESRHAIYFLDVAVNLLPELQSVLHNNDLLYLHIDNFLQTGTGLPIPLERNLYEALWNATLEERFVLMHLDTEKPGINRLKQKIASTFSKAHPDIAVGLEIVLREEITHARLGKKWLQYLIPNNQDRDKLIERTRLFRGMLLLTSSAHYQDKSLTKLINETIRKLQKKSVAS